MLITKLLLDGQFNGMQGDIVAELGIALNTAANEVHVLEIEWHTIQTNMEFSWRIYTMIQFQCVWAQYVLKHIYYCMIFWLNSFPAAGGISYLLFHVLLVSWDLQLTTHDTATLNSEHMCDHRKHTTTL